MRKKYIRKRGQLAALVMALAICAGLFFIPVQASETSSANTASTAALTTPEKADALHALGLFNGTGTNSDGTPIYELEHRATRNQAAALLTRLMGKEAKAAAQYSAGILKNPFQDVPEWTAPNVTWLYENFQINGYTETTFGGSDPVTAQQFAAMVLRALGYTEDKGDFVYANALDFAVEKGLMTERQRVELQSDFLRAGVVEICYNALHANMKNSRLTLQDKLTNDGVFRHTSTDLGSAGAIPVSLKYRAGGREEQYWVEEIATTTSPCADVDGDGKLEIIFNVQSVICTDAATGNVKWSTPSGHDVSENLDRSAHVGIPLLYIPTQLEDLDGDGNIEIITFSRMSNEHTFIAIYDGTGHFKNHWELPFMVRAVCIDDLDGDGKKEIAVGLGVGSASRTDNAPAVYLYDCNGNLKSGWPQDCGYGLFSNSIAPVDLDGDGVKELVMLTDQEWMHAFKIDGSAVVISDGPYAGKTWRQIGIYENYDFERQVASGQANIDNTRESRNAIMGTKSGIIALDMDGDGQEELVCTSMIVNLNAVGAVMAAGELESFDEMSQYFTCFILNKNHSRYTNAGKNFDWTQMPTDLGTIVSLDDDENLSNPDLTPVAADLDGDGNLEFVFSSYDGKVHCFHLDGTEHGAWPFYLDGRSASVLSFASKPVIQDVNHDGRPEIIFTTYTKGGQTEQRGKLYILDYTGRVLTEETLPVRWGSNQDIGSANGAEAAPVLADVDNDGRPEIIVTTHSCGVCVYDIG